jgi:hypothetical protein
MAWFLRSQSSDTRIGLMLNSSASTDEGVRYQPKWRARPNAPSTMDAFVSSSEAGTEEEVTRPIDRDRAKTATQKGKANEDSSSQSGSSSAMGGIMSTLKKLGTSFIRVQM